MRVRCGQRLARRDKLTKNEIDSVAGVPDSGIAHAIGYANESGVPFSRPFIKYTPTWPRSFMPTIQSKRDLIAKMKLIPVRELIEGQRLLLARLPADPLRLQVHQFLPLELRHGADCPPGDPGIRGR